MKTLVTAVAAVLFSLTAFVQESNASNNNVTGIKTRADVVADLMDAIARGERPSTGDARPDPVLPNTSTLTRADVVADLMAAIARGERPRTGDARPDPVLPNASTLTRAEVRGDLMAVIARGELPRTGEASEYPLTNRRANAHRALAMAETDCGVTPQL